MYRIINYLSTTSLILFSLAACASGSPKTVAVTEKEAGSTVNLGKGDVLEVILVGNPTTGYSWEPQALDTTILKQKGDWDFEADNTTPGFVGSPGKITMRFEALGAGQTTLKLVYHQSFDPSTPPAETFEVTVLVK